MATTSLALSLLQEAQRFLDPLSTALASEAAFSAYLATLGWNVPASSFTIAPVAAAVGIGSGFTQIGTFLSSLASSDSPPDVDDLLTQIGTVKGLVTGIAALATAAPPTGIPADAWTGFTGCVLDQLLTRYLAATRPALLATTAAIGLVDGTTSGTSMPPATIAVWRWDRLATVFGDPSTFLAQVFGWGSAQTPQISDLVQRWGAAGALLGLPVTVANGTATLTVYQGTDYQNNSATVSIAVQPLPSGNGLSIAPSVVVTGATPAPTVGPFSVDIEGSFEQAGMALQLSPGSIAVSGGGASSDISGSLTLTPAIQGPLVLLGRLDSHHLQIDSWSVGLDLTGTATAPLLELQVAITGGQLVVDPGELDGFVGDMLGDAPMIFAFAGLLGWSAAHGFRFQGQAGLTIVIPINATIGVATVDALTIGASVGQGPLEVDLTVSGDVAIGPVSGSIDGIGVSVLLTPASAGQAGLFGSIDPSFGFKPPDGLGLSIDSGPISGGGYLFFDATQQSYAGVATLSFESFCITVVGLLTTRMPDGSSGFSLLLIVTVQFPPIQLGFGFTLNGLGGLVGINRSMVTDALRDGIKQGTVDAIMFPQDPIRNAPQIISSLTAIFPPTPGVYTFGPMVMLGWGSPAILTIEMGVILELPSPLRLVILGKVLLLLPVPDEQLALLVIDMDMLGIIDFDQDQASFDAILLDSRVVTFPITGQMAMRMSWGQNSTFAVAVGGFNPNFTPPPNFPTLDPVAINLSTGDNPRINLSAYLALTANSFQVGAHFDLYAAADLGFVGSFSVTADLGFDVLIHFDPFAVAADLGASVSINRNGKPLVSASLDASLTGPSPWHAVGKVTFDWLGSHSIGFDVSIGPAQQPTLSPVDVFSAVAAAFEDVTSWSSQLPPQTSQLITLRASGPNTCLYAHPLGSLTVRQQVVPLGLTISKFGNAQPSGATLFTLTGVSVPGLTIALAPVSDDFSPGQFETLTDEQQLTSPTFESMQSGADLSLAGIATSPLPPLSTDLTYEEGIIDVDPTTLVQTTRWNPTPVAITSDTMIALARSGPLGRAPQRAGSAQRYAGPSNAVTVLPRRFVIASRDNLAVPTGISGSLATGTSHAQASQALVGMADADNYQVVGSDEVTA